MEYFNIGVYQGFWENGRRHGEGLFTYKNGDVYSGWWKFGDKEGYGTYEFKDTQMKMIGDWEKGQLKNGRWTYPNGVYWQGAFENNKPRGEGTWFFKNGNSLAGTFEQKDKVVEDGDEPEVDENGDPITTGPKFDLIWHTKTNIAASAHQVNSVEQ